MRQITQVWNALGTRQKVIVVGATALVFAAVLMLARLVATPGMALLYAGLESGPAGEVVSVLEQKGVTYDVRGGSIFVESSRRDELRMTLASEGLPANTGRGYELLDSLTGFGTTSQMFDAAYWRAKEGELARTIVAHPSVRLARVHIATTGSNPFQRDIQPTASVAITTNDGQPTTQHARAVQFLVASAVAGLVPEQVSVIDSKAGLISLSEDAPANLADTRADLLRQKVVRLLEARVGPGNAMVEVSVDTITRSEQIFERRIDPESRVVISTDVEELSNSASGRGGDVTVASNLPQGDAANGESEVSETSETRERTNYEISETERQITQAPGAVARLTVAVLLNGVTITGDDGAERFEPRPEEELSSLRELVASAVGFDEARGDVITLKTMAFEAALPMGTEAARSWTDQFALDAMSAIKALILGAVALVLGLFVLRPLLLGQRAEVAVRQISASADIVPDDAELSPLSGEIRTDDEEAQGAFVIGADAPDQVSRLPDLSTPASEPAERLRALINARQDETIEILRSWLEAPEEKA